MRLHLGCHKRYLPGFVHVDLADFPHIEYQSSADDLSMFADESAELIYASHILEYWDRFEAVEVLKEWRRVLKPGGTVRLGVPDFEALLEVYRRTGDLLKIIGPLFGRMEIPTQQGPRFLYHRNVYDLNLLTQVLEAAGFKDVRRFDWQTVMPEGYDDHSQAYFPHMDKANGLLISLNVEATRA